MQKELLERLIHSLLNRTEDLATYRGRWHDLSNFNRNYFEDEKLAASKAETIIKY